MASSTVLKNRVSLNCNEGSTWGCFFFKVVGKLSPPTVMLMEGEMEMVVVLFLGSSLISKSLQPFWSDFVVGGISSSRGVSFVTLLAVWLAILLWSLLSCIRGSGCSAKKGERALLCWGAQRTLLHLHRKVSQGCFGL